MKVYVGADHNGFHLKESLESYLKEAGFTVIDEGNNKLDPADDFPLFAEKAAHAVLRSGHESRAILLCGSGQGMCMAANRHKGIRAALGYDHLSVRSSRNDDDANVLCLPAASLSQKEVYELSELFLNTQFAGAPRYKRRIQQMDA